MVCSVKDQPIHTWDMKDSTFLSPDTAIFHNYQQSGWFAPTLLLDNMGCVREIQLDSVLIYEPDASFNPKSPNPICKLDSIYFKANNNTYSNYIWSGSHGYLYDDSVFVFVINCLRTPTPRNWGNHLLVQNLWHLLIQYLLKQMETHKNASLSLESFYNLNHFFDLRLYLYR